MIDVKTYPVAHNKNSGGGGGKTYMIGGQSNVPSNLYVNSINASLGNIKHLTTTSLSSNDANFIYVTANDGNIYKLQGNDLDFYNGHIANLAVDCITADSLDTKNLSALKATIEELIAGNITAKDLTVTGTAHFFELIIDKIRSVGGQLILTPTSCIVDYVQYYKNDTLITDPDQYSTADYYDIYWRGSDPYGRAVNNEWIVNDQAICQSFNNAAVGTNNNVTNKYYWMLVNSKLDDKYINLKTGETTSQQNQTTYNTIYVGMWNTTWTENDNTHDNQIEWNCAVQTIDDVPVSGVNWEAISPTSSYALMGTMQTSNKLFGLKITPTGDNKNRMTDKLKFTFEQETSRTLIPATQMNITVTFVDDTFMYFPNVEAKHVEQDGKIVYVKENGHYVFELDLSAANNPISIITVVCAQDVDWHLCHGIRLNNNVKAENCTGYPEAGDNIVQLGWHEQALTDEQKKRQAAIIISAYNSPDPALEAPSYAHYQGINDFNLGSHRGSYIDANGAKFVGDITLCSVNGKTMEETLADQEEITDGLQTQITNNLSELRLTAENIRTWVSSDYVSNDTLEDLESTIDQTAGMIRSEVKRSYIHSEDHLDNDNSTSEILNMNWSGVNENSYYKVTIRPTSTYTEKHKFIFQVERSRNSDYATWGKPTYGSQNDPYGFDLMLNMTFITGSTGSWNDGSLYINEYNLQYSNGAVIGTVNTSYGETYVELYVRGGSKYLVRYSEACQVSTYRDDVLGVVTEPIIYTPTESSIVQTAERISMYVVETEGVSKDELKRTGIDITSGNVVINADQTTINGNLKLTDTANGMTVYDSTGMPRINIQPKSITDIAPLEESSLINVTVSLSYSANTPYWSGISTGYSIKDGMSVVLQNVSIHLIGSNSTYPSSTSIYGRIRLYNNNYFTQTVDVTFSKDSNGTYKPNFNPMFEISGQNGNERTYYVEVSIDSFSNSADAAIQFSSSHDCSFALLPGGALMTYIGTDGFYTHTGTNQLLKTDANYITMQMGRSGLRLSNPDNAFWGGKLETICGQAQNASGTTIIPAWLPFYNYTPIVRLGTGSSPYLWTSQLIYVNETDSHTKYAWEMDPTRDAGDVLVVEPAKDNSSNKQESWIILPPYSWTDSNGNTYQLPVGYKVTIWNALSGYDDIFVTPYRGRSGRDCIIIDANGNQNDYIRMDRGLAQCNEIFMYAGTNAGQYIWLEMHDVA